MRGVVRRGGGALVALVISLSLLAGTAVAEDPLYLNWAAALPGLTGGYDPTSADDCKSGKLKCVDAVIREMTRRFDGLAHDCEHDALFALAYLRTTEQYRVATTTPGFFEDPAFVNHEDAVFARYYFDAYDAWHRGDVANTPPAWRVALQAADERGVTGNGNVLLGISAHINRDLPFVLWEIGLTEPDGTSRKPDHDAVNGFLNQVSFYPEANRRFDPSMSEDQAPGTIHSIIAWREQAWRNAERLRAAEHDPVQLAAVKASIEQFALAEANAIVLATAYGPLQSSSSRDAYCALNHDD